MAPPISTGETGDTCPRCSEKGTLTCTGCNDIRYCSPECQQADWATHKISCGALLRDLGPRPSADVRRIVAFLPDENKPRFVWAPIEQRSSCESVDMSGYLETSPFYKGQLEFSTNPWTNKALDFGIKIIVDDNFGRNYSADNKPVVTATQGATTFSWCGPIVAYCGRAL